MLLDRIRSAKENIAAMRTVREAINACLTLPDSYEDYPFGLDSWAVIRRHSNK